MTSSAHSLNSVHVQVEALPEARRILSVAVQAGGQFVGSAASRTTLVGDVVPVHGSSGSYGQKGSANGNKHCGR